MASNAENVSIWWRHYAISHGGGNMLMLGYSFLYQNQLYLSYIVYPESVLRITHIIFSSNKNFINRGRNYSYVLVAQVLLKVGVVVIKYWAYLKRYNQTCIFFLNDRARLESTEPIVTRSLKHTTLLALWVVLYHSISHCTCATIGHDERAQCGRLVCALLQRFSLLCWTTSHIIEIIASIIL